MLSSNSKPGIMPSRYVQSRFGITFDTSILIMRVETCPDCLIKEYSRHSLETVNLSRNSGQNQGA